MKCAENRGNKRQAIDRQNRVFRRKQSDRQTECEQEQTNPALDRRDRSRTVPIAATAGRRRTAEQSSRASRGLPSRRHLSGRTCPIGDDKQAQPIRRASAAECAATGRKIPTSIFWAGRSAGRLTNRSRTAATTRGGLPDVECPPERIGSFEGVRLGSSNGGPLNWRDSS